MKTNQSNSCGSRKGSAFLVQTLFIIAVGIIIAITSACVIASCGLAIPTHAESDTNTVRTTVYHRHTGSSGGGGGCYSITRTGTRTYEEPCGGTLYYWGSSWDTSECSNCGASYHGNRGGESCPHSTTRSESYTYYELGCGRSESTVVGYITYHRDTTEWAKEVVVTVEYENIEMGIGSDPYVMNGQAQSDGTFIVTENGTYTFGINADSNSNVGNATYTINISNIDHTSPTVNDYTLSPTEWVREGVELSLNDVVDIQPDGTGGCGMHELPYSYDGGVTWTDDSTHFYEDNGDYEVLVRDALENTTTVSFTIDNIDHEAPNINIFEYDHTRNVISVTITVECDDILSDGREGVGLDDLPYSYDGGRTWTDSTTLTLTHNQLVEFRVRDKLGNIASLDANITNIDDYMPTVSHMLYPGYWTNNDVEIFFDAYDRNPDGSDGIGLPNDCFSYDSGNTWTSDDSITVSENCNVHVAVRDKNGNTNYYSLDIINIDRIAPGISAAYNLADDKKSAVLSASGSDGESGINYESFTWSGPEGGSGASIVVTTNGTYTVTGYDNAGNSASASVTVDGIRWSITKLLSGDGKGDGLDDSDGEGLDTKKIERPLIDNKSAKRENISTDSANKQGPRSFFDWLSDLWKAIKNWWNGLSDFAKWLIGILGLAIIGGLIFLLFLMYRSVAIYVLRDQDKYLFLAYKYIKKEEGVYIVVITESVWERAETTHFKFRFGWLFALLHKDDTVTFRFPNGVSDDGSISRYIEIEAR